MMPTSEIGAPAHDPEPKAALAQSVERFSEKIMRRQGTI
jgi:hypothetical protein